MHDKGASCDDTAFTDALLDQFSSYFLLSVFAMAVLKAVRNHYQSSPHEASLE